MIFFYFFLIILCILIYLTNSQLLLKKKFLLLRNFPNCFCMLYPWCEKLSRFIFNGQYCPLTYFSFVNYPIIIIILIPISFILHSMTVFVIMIDFFFCFDHCIFNSMNYQIAIHSHGPFYFKFSNFKLILWRF